MLGFWKFSSIQSFGFNWVNYIPNYLLVVNYTVSEFHIEPFNYHQASKNA